MAAEAAAPDWQSFVGVLKDSPNFIGARKGEKALVDTVNEIVRAAKADGRSLDDLASEFSAVREATLALLRSLDHEALARKGTASGHPVSAGALAHIIPGHLAHHGRILEERYLL